MKRLDIVAEVAKRMEGTKADAEKYLNTVLGVIADNLTEGDGEVALPDFGRFYVKHVAERQGVNPATGEKITIEARDKVVFKPSDNMGIYSRKHC